MNTVRDIIWSKTNRKAYTIEPRAFITEAVEIFSSKDISGLIVVEDQKVIGTFSERELARQVIAQGKDPSQTKIIEVMDAEIFSVDLETTIEDCMYIMTNEHKRHLPVIQNKKLVGVVSIGDIVKAKISKQEQIIDQLQSYITS